MLTITVKMVLDAKRRHPDYSDEQIEEVCNEMLAELALDRELNPERDELESVPNCDFFGTGEGLFHGVIG